jgi:hypothetical protein
MLSVCPLTVAVFCEAFWPHLLTYLKRSIVHQPVPLLDTVVVLWLLSPVISEGWTFISLQFTQIDWCCCRHLRFYFTLYAINRVQFARGRSTVLILHWKCLTPLNVMWKVLRVEFWPPVVKFTRYSLRNVGLCCCFHRSAVVRTWSNCSFAQLGRLEFVV